MQMTETEALARAREIYADYVGDWLKSDGTGRRPELLDMFMREIRKESERADHAEFIASEANAIRRECEDRARAREEQSAETIRKLTDEAQRQSSALLERLAELAAAQQNMAALEFVVRQALGEQKCGNCSVLYPLWRCWKCLAESALRVNGGALAEHDKATRKAVLLAAAKEAGREPSHIIAEWWQFAQWLRERAERAEFVDSPEADPAS